jgi:hypothetical protein
MEKKIKVAIWDDREDQLNALLESIENVTKSISDVEVLRCTPKEISLLVQELESRLSSNSSAPIPFLDELDVLCIDYDLRALEGQSWLTADALAGLVHAFSDCPYVVALNRPPRVAFDLTMLGGWDGLADLQTIPAAISRPAFWMPPEYREPQFRPWEWLDLRTVKATFLERIAELEAEADNGEADIFQFFGFDKEKTWEFSWRALGALSNRVRGEDPRLTFSEYLKDGVRALPPEKLLDISLDKPSTRKVALRLIAFELSRWLREQVLAGQDVLVDVPHLVARAPWLLGKDQSLNSWNRGIGQGIVSDWINLYSFKRTAWTGRACFTWSGLQGDRRFTSTTAEGEISDTSPPQYGDFVFLEDASCFAEKSRAQSFTASFGNIWDERYVMKEELLTADLPYGPQVRFAI